MSKTRKDTQGQKPNASDTPRSMEKGVTPSLFAPCDWPGWQLVDLASGTVPERPEAPRDETTRDGPLSGSTSDWLTRPTETFEAWIASPGANGGRGFSVDSRKVYGAMWGKFVRFCIGHGASAALANEGVVRNFIEELAQERMHQQAQVGSQAARSRDIAGGGRQVRRYLSLLARVQQHLVLLGMREDNPAGFVLSRTDPEPDRPVPSPLRAGADVRLRSSLVKKRSDWREARDRAIVEVLVGSGMTSRQLRSLRDDPAHFDLDAAPAWMHPVAARRGAPDPGHIPLSREAAASLEAWLQIRRSLITGGDVLFPSNLSGDRMSAAALYRAVAESLRAAQERDDMPEAAHLGPRTLRHTFATRQLRAGRPLEVLQRWLGHRRESSTAVYLALVADPLGFEPA